MALLSTPSTSLFRLKTPTLHRHHLLPSLSFPRHSPAASFSSFRLFSLSSSSSVPDEWGEKSGSNSGQEPESSYTKFTGPDPSVSNDEDEWGPDNELGSSGSKAAAIPDEWGDKSGVEPELESAYTRFTAPDPPIREDEEEWGPGEGSGNDGSGAQVKIEGEDKGRKNWELKKCLVDTLYGSEFGFRASAEVRAEASELVTQLEAANPTPNPAECPALLDGNWVLVYTAASELLPLLALGSTSLLKVEQILQAIDTANRTVENSTTLTTPLTTCSLSATATFDVRTPSRIQVQFKEASFKPPEIKSRIDVPDSVDVFGQRIPLSPVQQLLNPLQEAAASISRTLYGLPPLKIPLPGERTESWLLITYLDEDLRISIGDGGGLFVLVREGSPLLEN